MIVDTSTTKSIQLVLRVLTGLNALPHAQLQLVSVRFVVELVDRFTSQFTFSNREFAAGVLPGEAS